MTEVEIHRPSSLAVWADDMQVAGELALKLKATSHAKSFAGNTAEIAMAILAGAELGLKPIAALQSFDVIQGQPRPRAHAIRGMVQSRGHSVQVVEASATLVRMRGRRRGEQEWQEVVWTIERATQLGLTSKDQWKKQPETMLKARATAEICRLIAADVLHAMPYAAEEVDEPWTAPREPVAAKVTAADYLPPVTPSEPVVQADALTGEVVEVQDPADYDPTAQDDWTPQA